MTGSSIDLVEEGDTHKQHFRHIPQDNTHSPTHTPTHTERPQHTMLLFPHAYIHAQSLVMVSSSSLLFSVLPFVACGSEGGGWLHWPRFVILQVNITPITLTHTLNSLSAVFHTETTCHFFMFFIFCNASHTAVEQQHTLGHQHVLMSDVQHQHWWAQVPAKRKNNYKQWSGFIDITTKTSVWLCKYSKVAAKW